MNITEILKEAGYEVIEGGEAVRNAIGFDYSKGRLCSGYGVFPDGDKCPGCSDCCKAEEYGGECESRQYST